MPAFQPLGDRARWRILYDLLKGTPTGEVLTYDEMGEALDLDPADRRQAIQAAMRRAAIEHEQADDRAVKSVPNGGYRVVPAQVNLDLAREHRRKSDRSLARGESKVIHVDLRDLDSKTRHAFEVVAIVFAEQRRLARTLDLRQSRLEDAVRAVSARAERTEEEVREMQARLRRLEGDDEPL